MLEKIMNLLGFEKTLDAHTQKPRYRWKWRRKKVHPVSTSQAIKSKPIHYLMNDMTTPNLVKSMMPPTSPVTPRFVVKNYSGGGFPRDSVQSNAANCYVTLINTLNFFNKFVGRDGIKPLTAWAGTGMLSVIPRSGVDLNAFYNRRSLQFFYFMDPNIKRIVSTADSSDIVAHELGHAILDSYRKDTWSAASLEVWSFHEAFADLTALLHIMTYDEVLIHSLAECNNDITKNSTMTRLAEDVGRAIYSLDPNSRNGRNPNCLRSAINNFKYTNPSRLPKQAPHNKLAAECHSFGRVFLGAFYDFLVAVYQDTRKSGHQPLAALKHARDVTGQYSLRAIQNAPLNAKFYDSMGRTLLWVAKNSDNGRYLELMRTALIDRRIIRHGVKSLSAAPVPQEGETIVKVQSTTTMKLSDHFAIRAMSDNPLYDVEIEIPMEEAYFYDNDRNAIDSVSITSEKCYSAAQDFINYLHLTNDVDDTAATHFEVRDGKLVRTYID